MSDKSSSAPADSEENVNLKSSFSHRISREKVQNRYGDLLDSLPIIIYIAEPRPPFSPIYVSKGIEMLGYTQDEWHAAPDLWIDRLHEDDRERVLRETEKAIGERRENEYEYRIYARDGSVRWFYDKGRFVCDETGEAISWEGFLLDITQRKRNEENRTRSNVKTSRAEAVESGGETILLVEDEEIIREMMRQILLMSGYEILTAANGAEALRICETNGIDFDLLITDFNMPQMNGRELAEKMTALCGEKKILYISGFTDDDEFLKQVSSPDNHFIAKPFSPEALTAKVAEILKN